MPEMSLSDDPMTVAGLQSLGRFLDWSREMPKPSQEQFWLIIRSRPEAVRAAIAPLMDDQAPSSERLQALGTISGMLFPDSDDPRGSSVGDAVEDSPAPRQVSTNSMEDIFIERVRELMGKKHVTQKELATKIGCTQPAISQMLNRRCRPQKLTILKIAAALGVDAQDLWPDLEVAEMLDAVDSFQSGYVMTEAEARAFRSTTPSNRPKLQAKALPSRQ